MTAALLFFRANWRWALPTLALIGMAVALMLTRATLSARTAQLDAEKAAHRSNVEKLVTASERAAAALRAAVAVIETRNAQLKDAANDTLAMESRVADDAARDYIRMHQAAPSCGSGTDAAHHAEVAADPGQPESAGRTPIMVSEADVLICTANTTRLLNAQKWALSLGSPSQEPR